MSDDSNIYFNNDRLVRWQARKRDLSTNLPIAATGLSGVIAFLAATKGGATIHATLSISLTEIGTTGFYAGTIDATAINAHLTSYIGGTVWECIQKANDFEEWREVSVLQYREST